MAILTLAGVCTQRLEIVGHGAALAAWIRNLVPLIGMNPVGEPHVEEYAHWPDASPSVVQFLEESALVAHAYGEADYIELILHSCKAIPDHEYVAQVIIHELGLRVRVYQYDAHMDWKERVESPWRPETWPAGILAAPARE